MDFMEIGSVIPLENGWFLDKDTEERFRYNEDGDPIFESEMTAEDYRQVLNPEDDE